MAIRFQRRAFRLFIRTGDIVPLARRVLNRDFREKEEKARSEYKGPQYTRRSVPPREIVFHERNA